MWRTYRRQVQLGFVALVLILVAVLLQLTQRSGAHNSVDTGPPPPGIGGGGANQGPNAVSTGGVGGGLAVGGAGSNSGFATVAPGARGTNAGTTDGGGSGGAASSQRTGTTSLLPGAPSAQPNPEEEPPVPLP